MASSDPVGRSWELALGLLFQVDVGGARLREAVEVMEELEIEPDEVSKLAVHLSVRVVGRRREIDRLIRDSSQNFALARISAVDRNILRLAVSDLLAHPEEPTQPILRRAARLAEQYGGSDSPRFVRGVLKGAVEILLNKGEEGLMGT